MKRTFLFPCLLGTCMITFSQEMNYQSLKLTLAQQAVIITENENMVQYDLEGINIYLVVDEVHNRMRFMSPIVKQSELKSKDLTILMEANFDRALDAKYALYNEVLWSVFAHPLKELREEQIKSAFLQVQALVKNYGSTYTSSDVVFGGNQN